MLSTIEFHGYRPITLLNCDFKLVMQIIANRLDRPPAWMLDSDLVKAL